MEGKKKKKIKNDTLVVPIKYIYVFRISLDISLYGIYKFTLIILKYKLR